jgi:hypothetical protein
MKYLKKYKLFESKKEIITKEEFPSEYDIRDFFFDLIDDMPYSDVKISNSGYVSLTTDYLYKTELRSQMLYDMSFEDNWLNKEIESIQDTWKNIILPIESFERHDYYPFYISLDSHGSDFEDKYYENIINGNLPAYPIIELERIYFDDKDKDKLDLLYECLRRLYEATGFRPIGHFHTEDFVDEDTGDVVTLYVTNIKLLKVTDVEYKKFIKSSVLVDNPRMEENIEMTKKFI